MTDLADMDYLAVFVGPVRPVGHPGVSGPGLCKEIVMTTSRFACVLVALCGALSVQAQAPAAPKDIVDTAVSAGQFKTLAAALTAAGLVDTLKGPGPFTVFAPTDEAFAKLPPGTVEELLKPENKAKLTAVLTHHVAAGKVMAADVKDGATLKTVNGTGLTAAVKDGVTISGAHVIKADIVASNGVIHVIDTVLLP
jgi:uncharacterized surface protein with fasciclin (FAS1) repeats